MISLFLILMIISVFILSLIIIYGVTAIRINSKSSSPSSLESQRLTHSTHPSIDIITKKLTHPINRSNLYRNSNSKPEKPRAVLQPRSQSLATNLTVTTCSNKRRSSIVDPKQMAQIEFSLPPTAEKMRRRSVAVCNNIIESKRNVFDSIIQTIKLSNQPLPCLVSFSIIYNNSSQLKIYFSALKPLPSTVQLERLTIQVKLIPDGKVKCISIKKIIQNENVFAQHGNECFVQFSNVPVAKFHDKALLMKFYGKSQTKRSIQLGQVGKIYFNQIKDIEAETRIDFIHEIETIRTSSMEALVSLEQKHGHYLTVEIQRIKGLKIDQKNPAATCYFQVILLDRHRPLSTHQTKLYRLNAATFALNESFDLNILAFNSTNADRIMIMINLYSNANNANEHRCVARVKIAAPYFCSGTGTIHWQQLQQRQSFSMWHKLIKQ